MNLAVEILILCLLYGLGLWITQLLSLPVPPVLTGMALLLGLLVTGVIKPERLEKASRFFYRHMMLFLVPSIVGVMKYWGILKQEGWELFFIIVAGTTFVIMATAWGAMLVKRGSRQNGNG